MSTGRVPPGSIPVLTEVVNWPAAAAPLPAPAPVVPVPVPTEIVASPVPSSMTLPAMTPAPGQTSPHVQAAAPEPALGAPAAAPAPPPVPVPVPVPVHAPAPVATVAHAISEAQLAQRVFTDLQRQVDLMLEVRLREVLAPVLARATDSILRDARKELTAALHDIVSRSVARELRRRDDS
jgi:hypothetical protein